jgi:glycosyltransferase involved in cell wall biosynthesis
MREPWPNVLDTVAGVRAEGDCGIEKGVGCGAMDLSVVIPVKNEAGNIAPLVAEIAAALDEIAGYEIVYVDDGSEDSTVAEIRRLQAQAGQPPIRLIRHARSYGQSAAIRSGIRIASGFWIATLDGDGQNDPADIPALWRMAQGIAGDAGGNGNAPRVMIVGHRGRRQDSWSKRRASAIANAVRRRLLRDDTPDTGCGLKLFPRALFLDLPYFDHMHRFLPALVLREGGTVCSEPVNHRPRQRGMSKYGVLDRLGVGIIDLFGVLWLRRRFTVPELVDTETAQVETPFAETPQAEAAMRNAAPPLRAARPEPALR